MFVDQNYLNQKAWQITKKYAEAKRNGFLIEATVLFNYKLRHNLLIIINNILNEQKGVFKKSYLEYETNQLAELAFNKNALSKELRDKLKDYYENYRSKIIHEILTGDIDYNEIQLKMNESMNILASLQELIIGKPEIGEIEESK